MNLNNTVAFMESNEFEVPADLMIYYSIALYEKVEGDSRLLHKKLLFKKDIVSPHPTSEKGIHILQNGQWQLGSASLQG